jgi:hypothetical protein
MANQTVTGRLYVLPTSREFELHQVAAGVLFGQIASDMPADQFARFNGTGALCSCIVGGDPLTLLSVCVAK